MIPKTRIEGENIMQGANAKQMPKVSKKLNYDEKKSFFFSFPLTHRLPDVLNMAPIFQVFEVLPDL